MKPHSTRRHSTLAAGLLVLGLGVVISGAYHHQAARTQTTAAESTTSRIVSTASHATTAQIAAKRTSITKRVQAYLNQVGADGTVSVTFKNLTPTAGSTAAADPVYSTGSLTASVNGTQLNTAASTYKLFIAAYLFGKQHEFSTSEQAAFDEMIVNSANDFGESVLSEYGASTIDAYLTAQGWNAVFHEDQAAATSSDHLAQLLTQLDAGNGSFTNAALRAWLLADMGKQVYRAGIPAALGDTATVQDKVGFLGSVNNDAAIVTTKAGYRYILVIMTHGHDRATLDFSQIKAIATQVNKLAYGA